MAYALEQKRRDWDAAREQFDRDGFAVFRGVLDAALVAEARRHVEWLQARHPELRPEHLHHWLMTDDPFWVRLVSDDRLLDIAELFIGPDIALFASHYICKPAGDGMPVLWHQDGSYWPLEPMEVVTLWLAVDDSTAENGCMRVIPGTHRADLQALRPREDVANVLGSGLDVGEPDEDRAVDVLLEAGDVSVHHPNVIHGSNPNASDRRRCGLTIRYIPTGTRIKLPEGQIHPSAFLMRGKAVPGVNLYNPRPRYVEGVHMPFEGSQTWGVAPMASVEKQIDPISRYEQDGFVFSPPLIHADLIERVVPRMDAVLAGQYQTGIKPRNVHFSPQDPPGKLRRVDQPHLSDNAIRRVITHPDMAEWIARMLDAQWLQVWATQLLVKPPSGLEAGSVGWHQDKAYWPYWDGEVFTVWIAISNVTEHSGPLRYVRGSHKWGLLQGSDSERCDIAVQRNGLSLPEGAVWNEVPVILPPGAVAVQHGLLLHGSGPNYNTEPRRSFLMHVRTERSRPTADNYYTEHLDNPFYAPVIYNKR